MTNPFVRQAALLVPSIRRLVDEVEQVQRNADESKKALESHYQALVKTAYHAILSAIAPDVLISVTMNGVKLRLPAGTLITMSHCIHTNEASELLVVVEAAHLAWMIDHLGPSGTFLDVGAATGATAIPVANRFGDAVRIIAYEPARRARRLLEQTLQSNAIPGIEIRAVAVSNEAGTATFREFQPDPDGHTPWRPEASSLVTEKLSGLSTDEDIVVPVVTLDADAFGECGPGPIVVKIDVEGFEMSVLRGAARLLRERRPFLSIDIHQDPFRMDGTTTGAEVQAFLSGYGYTFTTMDHVLLCEPAS